MTMYIQGFPMPPSVNRAFGNRRGPGRGRYKTAVYRAFEDQVLYWSQFNQRALGAARDMVLQDRPQDWLHLESQFCFPAKKLIGQRAQRKRLDVDNRIKLSTDALAALLRIDDSLIGAGTYRKVPIANDQIPHVNFLITWTPIALRC